MPRFALPFWAILPDQIDDPVLQLLRATGATGRPPETRQEKQLNLGLDMPFVS